MLEPVPSTLATVGSRVGARLIDALLVGAVSAAIVLLGGGVELNDGSVELPGWMQWVTGGFAIAYEIGLIALTGQTLGKRLVGIRVVDATTGAVPELDQAVRRAFPNVLTLVPFLGWLSIVAYLSAVWRPRRQGWHDSLAGTIVITTRVRSDVGAWPGNYPSS